MRGFDHGPEQLIQTVAAQRPDIVYPSGFLPKPVSGGKGRENVARTVAADPARAGQTQRGTTREPPALIGADRRVRGDHHND